MATPPRPADASITDVVARAIAGERTAWEELVEQFHRVVWKAVNMMTYDHEIRDDAFAATWLRLAERLESIREPEKLPGWLATTASNEVRQIVRQRSRQPLALADSWSGTSVADLFDDVADSGDAPIDAMLVDEERRTVRAAFGQLDESCRQLLTVLVLADPPLAYDEASERLGRPIGSLGPTRRRCLDKLRELVDGSTG